MEFVAKRIYLRPLEIKDLALRVKWINDREVSKTLMFDYPTSVAKTEKWFQNTLMDDSKKNFSIIRIDTDAVVGMAGLLDIDQKHKRAQLYITIGEKDNWGKGIATEVIPILLRYGFEELGLNKIYLYTLPSNERARQLYERIGFSREGILRQHYFCVGQLQDLTVHSILRMEWEKLENKD
jgi:RimJ/RimL family protein N-acetyltransferase